MSPKDPQDLIGLLIFVIGMVTSLEVSQMLGPYAAIIVASGAGAFLSISGNNTDMQIWQAMRYVSIRILLAIVITVPLAKFLQGIVPWLMPNISLIPLALCIGWIQDYNSVRLWFGKQIDRFTSKRIGDDPKQPPSTP